MKQLLIVLITCLYMQSLHANTTTYWSTKIKGIHTTINGTVALNLGNYAPTGPNPKGTIWTACPSNWVFFHITAEDERVEEKYIDRMLSVALSAFKTGSSVRLAIKRSETGKCYTSQIYDMG